MFWLPGPNYEYAKEKRPKRKVRVSNRPAIPVIKSPEKPHVKMNQKPAWLGRKR